jgi:hypothetical protein
MRDDTESNALGLVVAADPPRLVEVNRDTLSRQEVTGGDGKTPTVPQSAGPRTSREDEQEEAASGDP